MQFYLSVLDDTVKMDGENSAIGVLICKSKNRTIVEYALKIATNRLVWPPIAWSKSYHPSFRRNYEMRMSSRVCSNNDVMLMCDDPTRNFVGRLQDVHRMQLSGLGTNVESRALGGGGSFDVG